LFCPLEAILISSYMKFIGRRVSGADALNGSTNVVSHMEFVASKGGLDMRSFDLTPLMRSSVGFDHLSRLVDSALSNDGATAYPPYNIEKISDDDYQITMAVAGFAPDELDVTVQEGTLIISGRAGDEGEERKFLHRGIAKRAFERRYELADTIQVGHAKFENGLLQVDLKRVIPEHKKPRSIKIRSGEPETVKTIEASAA